MKNVIKTFLGIASFWAFDSLVVIILHFGLKKKKGPPNPSKPKEKKQKKWGKIFFFCGRDNKDCCVLEVLQLSVVGSTCF